MTAGSLGVLHDGVNILSIGVWNEVPLTPPSSDLVLVPRLSINHPVSRQIRYLANQADPGIGAGWTAAFDDTAWDTGRYGIGYDNLPQAADLIETAVPSGTFSVYTRMRFDIPDPAAVARVFLGADYDDGYMAWLNGMEVFRSTQMPAGTPDWNTNAASHESSNGNDPDFGPPNDIAAAARPVLVAGENVLAIGVWNTGAPNSSDLVLWPRLAINAPGADNCPDVPNPDQSDGDADGIGDACDPAP